MDTALPDPFATWLSAHRGRLVRLAAGVLKDEAWAEDVVQVTALRVWKGRKAEAARDLDAYARRAVWVNALRARARAVEHQALDDLDEDEEPAVPGGGLEELSALELEHALRGLPPAQQTVLRLRFYGGLSFREIGLALRISMNTAASRSRYALGALRARFTQSPPGEDP